MSESVRRIHGRFYLTLLNPSSYRISLFLMFLSVSLISTIINLGSKELLFRIPLSLGTSYLALKLDKRLVKGLEMNNLSKVYHVEAFTVLFWLMILIIALVINLTLKVSNNHVLLGMMVAIGFRICIFKSVFGARVRSLPLALTMPFLLLFTIGDLRMLFNLEDLIGGSIILTIAISWSILADRAGRPWIDSTFKLLRAYLLAWSENNSTLMEMMMSVRSKEEMIKTDILRFNNIAIVLPGVHPGPFNPVGGSDLPYKIKEYYSKKFRMVTMIMHSVSDHSMNIPSKEDVTKYINNLEYVKIVHGSNLCSEPITVKIGKVRVSGIRFGEDVILMLSSSPYGMEDIDEDIKREVEEYAHNLGLDVLIVDTHNSLGKQLEESDKMDMVKAAREVLDKLLSMDQHKFMVGYAESDEIGFNCPEDVGKGGISVIAIKVKDRIYTIGWADANNMLPNLREYIVEYLKNNGIEMLEICTSDTHATSGKARNREGYYTLGSITDWDYLSSTFLKLSKLAISRLSTSSVNHEISYSLIRVMGSDQFEDYAKALDRSLNLTKLTIGLSIVVFLIMLLTPLGRYIP